MPSGGHRGGIFPIGGFRTSTKRFPKPGLYALSRFSGYYPTLKIYQRYRNDDINKLNDISPLWRYSNDAYNAFPNSTLLPKSQYWVNERRYMAPALHCSSNSIREYLFNMLDPPDSMYCSGMGYPGVDFVNMRMHSKYGESPLPTSMKYLMEATSDDCSLHKMMETNRVAANPIQQLETLRIDGGIWLTKPKDEDTTSNPFPFVDANSSPIAALKLSSILYNRSDHRLNSRRHPIWMKRRLRLSKSHIPYLLRRAITQDEVISNASNHK